MDRIRDRPAARGLKVRIGIDLRIVHFARTGFHRYARGLVWSHRQSVSSLHGVEIVLLRHPEDCGDSIGDAPFEQVPTATPLFSPSEPDRLHEELAPLHLDVVHFPFSLLAGRPAPRVVLTIHDLTCVVQSDSMDSGYRSHYRAALGAASEVDRIVAVSQQVRADLIERGLSADKVVSCAPVTPFETGEGYFAQPADLDDTPGGSGDAPYVLVVGSIEPRKNLLGVLDAFAQLRLASDGRARLVICGSHGWREEAFREKLGAHPYRDDISIVRGAGDGELRRLLRGCAVFLNMSFYEGFGLPVLEALYEGACVVSAPVPSLCESGFPPDGLIDPLDPGAAGRRVAALLGEADARRSLAVRGRSAVSDYYRGQDPGRYAQLLVQP